MKLPTLRTNGMSLRAGTPRTDDDFGAVQNSLAKFGKRLRRIGAIGVEKAEQISTRRAEAGLERRAVAAIGVMLYKAHGWITTDNFRRAIFGAIVDHQQFQFQPDFRERRFYRQHTLHDFRDTIFLIVGRNDHRKHLWNAGLFQQTGCFWIHSHCITVLLYCYHLHLTFPFTRLSVIRLFALRTAAFCAASRAPPFRQAMLVRKSQKIILLQYSHELIRPTIPILKSQKK
jgi:hypothetical protein